MANRSIFLPMSLAHKQLPSALQASSVYLEKEIIPSLRSMIQKAQAPAKGKKGAPAQPPPKVTHLHHPIVHCTPNS